MRLELSNVLVALAICGILATIIPARSATPPSNQQQKTERTEGDSTQEQVYPYVRQLISKDQAAEALAILERISERRTSEYFFLKGRAQQELRQNTDAFASYSIAIYLDPSSSKARVNRALVRGALQDLQGAIAEFSAVLKSQPNHIEALVNRGVTHASLNQPDAAIQDFRRALSIQPTYGAAYLNLGLVYHLKGKRADACKQWRLASRYGERDASAWVLDLCSPSERSNRG